jgi:uncharacterized protein
MPVTVEREFQPNYFTPQDFVYYDAEAGQAYSHDGLRMIMVGEEMILSLQQALEEFAGDTSALILYQIGFDWGERHYKNTEKFILENYRLHKSIQEMPLSGYAFLCDRGQMASGWGRFFLVEEYGQVFVNLYYSCYAMTVGQIGRPACHIYAGIYAGIFSGASAMALACIEIICYSMGADYCRFLLGSQEAIDATSFWVESGMTYESILENIRDRLPEPVISAESPVASLRQ